jgi:CubicO group peptidase (beta-lactamase class C family)
MSTQDSITRRTGNVHRVERIQNRLVPIHYVKEKLTYNTIQQLMIEDNVPGVSMAFIDNGKITWQKTYGYSNIDDSVEVTSSTVFNAASLSKPVTAMAALKLVDQGFINLNEDVNNKLSGWQLPPSTFTKNEKVSLRRLVNHTSGIDNHLWSSYSQKEKVPTLTQMLNGEPPSIDPPVIVIAIPGQKFKYSNPGYSVIEKLIEDVTRMKFEEAMKELIFRPCGMNNSTFSQPVPGKLKKLIATGYTKDYTPFPYKLFPFKAAGGMWTTPSDLGLFLIALLDDYHHSKGKILSKAMADSVFLKTPERLGFSKKYDSKSGDLLFEHWGSNSGFTSYMVGSLAKKQALIIMTNSENGNRLMSNIARSVAVEYDWNFLVPEV